MNSKRMLLRLLQQVLSFSSLFVPQTRPALPSIEESVKELIVERRLVYFDLFTVKMKTNRTRPVMQQLAAQWGHIIFP